MCENVSVSQTPQTKEGATIGCEEGRNRALIGAAKKEWVGLVHLIVSTRVTLAWSNGVDGVRLDDEGLVVAGVCRACNGIRSREVASSWFCYVFKQWHLTVGKQLEHHNITANFERGSKGSSTSNVHKITKSSGRNTCTFYRIVCK